jgi:hypothetical protein
MDSTLRNREFLFDMWFGNRVFWKEWWGRMILENKMDDIVTKMTEKMPEKDRLDMFKMKNVLVKVFDNYLKPMVYAIAMFWLFNRVKGIVGLQDAIYICLVTIIVFLRMILVKVSGDKN